MNSIRFIATLIVLSMVAHTSSAGVDLTIVSISPLRHAITVPAGASIEIVFDRPVLPASFTATSFRFHVFGERSGPTPGSFTFLDGDTRVRFTPDEPFARGEKITVVLSHDIEAADSSNLRAAGYTWQFWTSAAQATREFTQYDILDTAEPGISPRPYGGAACDLDDDGFVDFAIVNEDTSDIRVFMSKADGTGMFDPFMTPTNPTGSVPSPNEASDFNGDGFVDMCTANTGTNTMSVLLGNGDGTFDPSTSYVCGSQPRGIAVLDADGDGDMDIATANTSAGNIALFLNSGNGTFGAPSTFDGGGVGEWALAAADMNNDGIMDLVVGARISGRVIIHRGNGNGTFTALPGLTSGLGYWMIVCADLNADGNMDITAAASNQGGIHLGDGLGGLGPASTVAGNAMVATDVGDLDGDGDLDWVVSDFSAGIWTLRTNNGAGSFAFDQTFPAGSNPACSLILDVDNDGALDLALIDEISDFIYMQKNTPVPVDCPGDADGNNTVDVNDISYVVFRLGAIGIPGTVDGDADGNGAVDVNDISYVVFRLGTSCP